MLITINQNHAGWELSVEVLQKVFALVRSVSLVLYWKVCSDCFCQTNIVQVFRCLLDGSLEKNCSHCYWKANILTSEQFFNLISSGTLRVNYSDYRKWFNELCIMNFFHFGWIMSEDGTRWINSILDWHRDIQKEVLENLV